MIVVVSAATVEFAQLLFLCNVTNAVPGSITEMVLTSPQAAIGMPPLGYSFAINTKHQTSTFTELRDSNDKIMIISAR
jgi:hypothetical protein